MADKNEQYTKDGKHHQEGHRTEIDFLRALAVILVVLFHLELTISDAHLFQSGFIGVDIFFVLSGYLMATILADIRVSWESYRAFLVRRFRRLYPMVIFAVGATLIGAYAFFSQDGFKDQIFQALSALFAVSNIYFDQKNDYWNLYQVQRPLLHTWSLSIEMQFYLIAPFILTFFRKLDSKLIFVFIILYVLAISKIDQDIFFKIYGRIWELIFGFNLFYFEKQHSKFIKRTPNWILLTAGIICLAMAILYFDASTHHPSCWTLLPVLGASLIILSGPRWSKNRISKSVNLISKPIARLSYSIYINHFIFLFFSGYIYYEFQDSNTAKFLVFFLIILTSAVTQKFIEAPFQAPVGTYQKWMPLGLVSFTAIACAAHILINGIYFEKVNSPVFRSSTQAVAYTTANTERYNGKKFPRNGKRNLLILGDSFGEDLLNAILLNGKISEVWNISLLRASPACNLIYIENESVIQKHVRTIDWPYCDYKLLHRNEAFLSIAPEVDLILWVGNWYPWNLDYLEQSFANLTELFTPNVVVFSGKSFGKIRRGQLEGMNAQERSQVRTSPSSKAMTNADYIGSVIPSKWFIDEVKLFCGDDKKCPVANEQGQMLTPDGAHLTEAGAKHYVHLLIQNAAFRNALGLPSFGAP